MAKDPYKLLGVAKTATDAEIKSAYRKLAKKLHPDVNPGDKAVAERFKEISAAYTLLSDKNLRAQYDNGQVDASGQQQNPFGSGGFGGAGFRPTGFGASGGDMEMEDLFASLFGMQIGGQRGGMASAMNRGRGGGFQQARRAKKGADIRYKLRISFLESIGGITRKIRGADGKFLNVKIPAGIEDGQTLRVRSKGQPGVNGGPTGDAKVDISVAPHKYYSRDGTTLRLTLPITLQEAVLGAKIKIPMYTGDIQVTIPAGTSSGKTLRLRGKGVKGGDLLVTPQIVLDNVEDEKLRDWAENTPIASTFDPRLGLNLAK